MNRLKIGFVLDDTIDSTDGVQQYVLTLGAWLERQGHEVHYLCGQSSRRDIAVHSLSRNVKIRFNGNRMTIPLPAGRQAITAVLQAEKFDVLHIQMPYSPWLAGRIIKLADRQKIALIGTFHILPHNYLSIFGSRALALLTKRTSRRLDSVLAVSAPAADFAGRVFGLRCEVLPNIFELDRFLRVSLPPKLSRQTLTILFLGRLVPRKGCQYLLEATAKLATLPDMPKFQVVVAGRGPDEARLKRFVRENKLENFAQFKGFIEEADKPALLASADIAVFPSTGGESFGIILLEAMAACRGAVLAGDNPGYASLMENHADQLFNPKNNSELCDKLAYFINNAEARRRAANWQGRQVLQYDVKTVGPKIVDIYQKALHKPAGMR